MEQLNKIMFFYRYFSLFITSVFFLANYKQHTTWIAIIVIGGFSISAIILNYLYSINANHKNFIKILVLIETVGNALTLIPTGGLNSPYLWYSLNTVLVTLAFLNFKYCFLNLMIYIIITTKISHILFNNKDISFWSVLANNSNLVLSFILITVVGHLLISLLNTLEEERNKLINVNDQLNLTNKNLKKSIEYIMSINHAVHNLVNQHDEVRLIKLLIEYSIDMTKTNRAFFISLFGQLIDYEVKDRYEEVFLTEECKNIIVNQKDKIINSFTPLNMEVNGKNLIVVEVKSLYQSYGILGVAVEFNDSVDLGDSDILYEELSSRMKLLSELGSIVFERYQLQDTNNRLLINDEQNRIANEVHDTVLQRLFSISCAIQTLLQKQCNTRLSDIQGELIVMKDSLVSSMKELREIVYKLSWRKNGENAFLNDISRYIDEISKLTGVRILFSSSGDQALLSCDMKRILCRITREAVGNAIRHSKCSNINVSIDIDDSSTKVEIKDNGRGFEINKDFSSTGLGLKNIYNLINSSGGKIDIASQCGIGTVMSAVIPNNSFKDVIKGEAV